VATGIVVAAVILPIAAALAFAAVATGTSKSFADGAGYAGLKALPLDLTEPELRPSLPVPRFQYHGWLLFELPTCVLGMLIGMFMSISGAALGTYFCSALFHGRARPAARLLSNFAASAMAYLARAADAAVDYEEGRNAISSTSDFFRSKFVGSFCGGLSAFAGTIGDIADAHFGAATEDCSLDRDGASEADDMRRATRWSKLFPLPGIQNLLVHWILTLVIMWLSGRFEAPSPAAAPQQLTVQNPIPLKQWGQGAESLSLLAPLGSGEV
ncbi:unnamed protein product, partial [Polarella glacialis]